MAIGFKKIIYVLLVAVVAVVLYVLYFHMPTQNIVPLPVKQVVVGSTTVEAEVVSTPQDRAQGLSGRTTLAEGKAMLFIFDSDDKWGIWMKDMNFPIDIIWADAEGTIITISEKVATSTYPNAFFPVAPARLVLEVPAGFVAAHGVAIGNKIVVQ